MGINNFYKLFKSTQVTWNELSGKQFVVDASFIIYQSILALQNINTLSDGIISTAALNTILSFIMKCRKYNINCIFVFDSEPPLIKSNELQHRKDIREKNADNEKRSWKMPESIVNDVKTLLTHLGISTIISPNNIDAEYLAAIYTNMNVADIVVTNDSDAIVFGAKAILKREKSKMYLITLENVLTELSVILKKPVTREDLAIVSVALGCDYAEKLPKIGIRTLHKIDPNMFTDEQRNAIKYFLEFPEKEIPIPITRESDDDAAIDFLVNEKHFNRTRVINIIHVGH